MDSCLYSVVYCDWMGYVLGCDEVRIKERLVGERYRPIVTVLKVKNGEPTKIYFNGLRYALIDDNYINGNKNKAKKRE